MWLFYTFDKTFVQPDGTKMTLAQAIMDHGVVTGLSKRGRGSSYISANNFSTALLEKISFDPNNPKKVASGIEEIIDNLKKTEALSTELTRVLLQFAYEAKESTSVSKEIKYFRSQIQKWFNTSMDQLTGAFKTQYTRPLTFLMATIIVFALNVDSILFVKLLYRNPKEPAEEIQHGVSNSDTSLLTTLSLYKPTTKNDSIVIQTVTNQINENRKRTEALKKQSEKVEESQSFSIGWNVEQLKENGAFSMTKIIPKILGLLSTILIILLLAPFLFDLGNKYSNVRGTGPKPNVELDD